MNNIQKAEKAWGKIPDWIMTLAAACDETSIRKTARQIGVSPALLSLTIRRSHHASLRFVEQVVREKLMQASVDCPVLGRISGAMCKKNQKKTFNGTNPVAVLLFRACNGTCSNKEMKKCN